MLKLLIAAPLLFWDGYSSFAHDREASQAVSLHAPITDQSASSRYEKKDPQAFSREQIAKDRDARQDNGVPNPNGDESNATGASDGAEGNSSNSGAGSFGAEGR